MHNVRPSEKHRPMRAIELDEASVAFLRLCDVVVGSAWATDRLTDVRRRIEEEARLLRSYAIDAECSARGRRQVDDEVRAAVAARLRDDPRSRALATFVELAREAEGLGMTLVLDDDA